MIRSGLGKLLSFILIFVSCSFTAVIARAQPNPDRVSADETLQQIGREIKQAILKKDIDFLLKYDLRGEKVNGITYDKFSVDAKKLKKKKSLLYCYLFDSTCLKNFASKHDGKDNPFLRSSIFEFFEQNKDVQIEVLFWHQTGKYEVARVVFMKPSFKPFLPRVIDKDPPLEKWGLEYVASDFVLTNHGWKYYNGIFATVEDEEGLGETND